MVSRIPLRLMLILVLTTLAVSAHAASLKYRWVYISANLLVDDSLHHAQDVMKRAKAAGYNGVLLNDCKFERLGEMDERYFRNVAALKDSAKELGMDIYPTVISIGYSEGMLAPDPNLVEGPPVKDALFQVRDRQADVVQDAKTRIVNADFEQASGDQFTGWGFQDGVGKFTFADKDVRHGGSMSIRMDEIGTADPQNGMARIQQSIPVSPYRQYHLSVWVKTQAFDTPGNVNVLVAGTDGRALCHPKLGIARDQDWTQYYMVFNSLQNSQVSIYFGVWGGRGGRIWWDDAQLEEVGLLNVIRRDGCPLVVKGEDGKVYEEGRDFEKVRDERMGTVPWSGAYEIYHKAPLIRLTPESRIREGQRLRVSFFHVMSVYDNQVTCCLSHPRVYSIIDDEIRRVDALLQPKGFMMSHDEIRVGNWCDLCQSRHLTPGQMLADNVKRCIGAIRKANPKTQVFAWSDMFDPYHNAVDKYYLVNGTWAGSWEGLPKDAIVLNWNDTDKRKPSMEWFAKRGNPQILAGYYDAPPERIKGWLDEAKGVQKIVGVMYTTWQNRYDDLEAFARAAWGGKP